jgi:methane/ammonia monooxygenase subunit B
MLQRLLFGWLACVALLGTAAAWAHGERAQEPYLRTRTAQWYDVKWSTDKLDVNERITITGKFRLFGDWPDAVQPPHTVFVSNATPGPVLVRVESYLNDVPARQSFANLEIGRDYEYRMVMQARIPGRYHVHPMIAIKGSGPLVGPGKWVEIGGNLADFKFGVATLAGEQIDDLQSWGVSNALAWHAMWLVVAVLWVLWWVRRPLLIPRYIALKKEREDLLTTSLDLKVAIGFLVLTIALAIIGFRWAQARFPKTVPLQAGTMKTPPLPFTPSPLTAQVKQAHYDVPGRSMRLVVDVRNTGDRPLSIGEFSTASIRFVHPKLPAARANVDAGYPPELLARSGLNLSSDAPLAPGERREIKLDATDASWEIERLTSFLNDVDSKFGGLLFVFDDTGKRYITEIGGPVVPVFTDLKTRVAAN